MVKRYDRIRGKNAPSATTSSAADSANPAVLGCPIPEGAKCVKEKLVGPDEEGQLMLCTNANCPFKGIKVHLECFELYEERMIHLLAQKGSARGWTDAQRRANLWEKKGQGLIARDCRCRCGQGNTKRDPEIYFQKAIQVQAETAAAKTTKKKKKATKNLPELNYPLQRGTTIPPPVNGRNNGHGLTRTESTTSSVDDLYVYRRERVLGFEPAATTHSQIVPDDNVTEVFEELVHMQGHEMIPAPPPAPLTRSFASAIKAASATHRKDPIVDSGNESKESSPVNRKVVETPKRQPQGKRVESVKATPRAQPVKSVSTTPSRPVPVPLREVKRLSLSIFEDIAVEPKDKVAHEVLVTEMDIHSVNELLLNKDDETRLYASDDEDSQEYHNGIFDEVFENDDNDSDYDEPSLVVVTKDHPRLALLHPDVEEIETILPLEYIPDWDPMTCRGFDLAEMILANAFLPGVFFF